MTTPRGTVEIDVYAVDERSVDKIKYLIECKCWSTGIPQHVVHAFTTVMHETGANIGFIVSRVGLQAGADRYTTNTNITGLTFEELQQRYFVAWWKNHFCNTIAQAAEKVCFYTEPFNSRRNDALAALSEERCARFAAIQRNCCAFSMFLWHADLGGVLPDFGRPIPMSIEQYKDKLSKLAGSTLVFQSLYWRDLLKEICLKLNTIEQELHHIFGCDIFSET